MQHDNLKINEKVFDVYKVLSGYTGTGRLSKFLTDNPEYSIEILPNEFCKTGFTFIMNNSINKISPGGFRFNIARDGNCGIVFIAQVTRIQTPADKAREILSILLEKRIYIYTGNQGRYNSDVKDIGFKITGKFINPGYPGKSNYRVIAVFDQYNPEFYES